MRGFLIVGVFFSMANLSGVPGVLSGVKPFLSMLAGLAETSITLGKNGGFRVWWVAGRQADS